MRRVVRMRRGAAIVEYLVVAALVVAAVLAVQATLKGNVDKLYNDTAKKASDAAAAVSALQFEK